MKKSALVLTAISTLFSFSAYSTVKMNNDKKGTHYEFSVEGLKLQSQTIEGVTFDTAKLIGVNGFTGIKYDIGSPEVPVIRFYVTATSAKDITVRVNNLSHFQEFRLIHSLKPVMDSVEKIPGARYKIVRNKNFASGSYPENSFDITPAGSVNHLKQFLVTLYPVQFNNKDELLEVTRSFNVDVTKNENTKSKENNNGIVFVIGAKFKNSPSLKAYMDLKKSLGFNIYTIDLATKVTAEQIRSQIQTVYKAQKDLGYAVIVGDADDAPGKSSTVISGLTDHYFSAIDTNDYNSDINGPDISVGRFSVSSESELAIVLKKYTRYIKGEFSSMSWLHNISFLATDDRYDVAEATHNYVIDTYTSKLGYTGNFPTDGIAGGDKLYAITNHADTKDVMDNISKGRSIINYSGHGATTYWAGPHISQDNVKSLNATTSSLPFVISNACVTGDYRVKDSFAETWQKTEWGAVMYYGSMDSTYWDEDDILERRMFDGIFTGGKSTFGDITTNGMSEVWKQYGGQGRSTYYWETYHMFGDPSISLRLK